ncbi:MAG: SGNH/GDSL hydrolase family protein [Calothrix sp. FI2-JRJ7]|nr:SGNH/GDSL hydrolase family protein [Calothrix sp. FI2-JRJ7]
MKKYFITAIIALLSLIMVLVTSSLHDNTSARTINQIYVFGDSLSDTGNMYRATNRNYPPIPPYFQGRYSNGQVWVEYLASKLALNSKQSTNFAFGGAMTGKVGNNGIPGLLGQVENFTKNQLDTNDSGLYVIWAGANDYIYGVADSTAPVINITQAVESLLNAGAKKVLVADLPDLGDLPATKSSASSQSLSAVTKAHNQDLAKSLSQLRQKFDSNSQIIELDISSLYRDAISNPSKYGFTNVTSACLNQGPTCSNPNHFLFWDGIHPTTAAHQIIAEKALTVLNAQTSQLQLGAV